jgi:hypothetical protein
MKRIKEKILKTKIFIYNLCHKVKSRTKEIHKILLTKKEADLDRTFDKNFYDVFTDWILELIQYGTLLSITLIIFNIHWLTLIKWVFPLGILRWLLFDLIKTYKKIK